MVAGKPPIPALAVHNPIHYFELPELFMELTSSMTGKSPSTTGAGSEGALTKGPFNMLSMIHDLNNTLVSYALTNYQVRLAHFFPLPLLSSVEVKAEISNFSAHVVPPSTLLAQILALASITRTSRRAYSPSEHVRGQ